MFQRPIVSQYWSVVVVGICLVLSPQFMPLLSSSASIRGEQQQPSKGRGTPAEEDNLIDRAVALICNERERDPQGSITIDQMARQPDLPITNPRVAASKKRAERLLPKAKRLVPSALNRIAAAYGLEPLSLNWIIARVKAVTSVKIDVEAHDNAAWRPSEPNSIIFGTVFLAGIRSDEAMITVLAHELTHAINGTDEGLQPLLLRVEARASTLLNRPVRSDAAAELLCDLVGIRAMRDQTGSGPSRGGITRRLSRALGKDCVRVNLTDETHLPPRETLRILVALQPELASAIALSKTQAYRLRD